MLYKFPLTMFSVMQLDSRQGEDAHHYLWNVVQGCALGGGLVGYLQNHQSYSVRGFMAERIGDSIYIHLLTDDEGATLLKMACNPWMPDASEHWEQTI